MELLHKADIVRRLELYGDRAIFIDPILDSEQIGEVTVDLRLGCDFLVSILTRKAFIGVARDENYRGIGSYFQVTRRELGDRFILYPEQVVLGVTLEYIGLPDDIYADVLTRSSYTRLGVSMNTMIQPGFRGCFPVELFNQGNNPIELVVGSRVFQTRLFELSNKSNYTAGGEPRKYFGNVRPTASRASNDADLALLSKIREHR